MKKEVNESMMDSFDLLASDNPDLVLIASVVALIKALRLSAKEHLNQRNINKSRADISQRKGDDDSYKYYLDVYFEEDNKYQLISETLQQFGIIDEEYGELQKATKR